MKQNKNYVKAREVSHTMTVVHFDLKNNLAFWEVFEQGEDPADKRPILEHMFKIHQTFIEAYTDAMIYGQGYYMSKGRPVTLSL